MPVFFMAGVVMVMDSVFIRMVMVFMIFPMAVVMAVVMGMVMFVVIQFDFHFFLRFKWGAFPGRKFDLPCFFHREAESAGILSIRGTN